MKKLGKRFYKDEDIDECDGGGAVAGGGDAGGAAGTAGADERAAAEPDGIDPGSRRENPERTERLPRGQAGGIPDEAGRT